MIIMDYVSMILVSLSRHESRVVPYLSYWEVQREGAIIEMGKCRKRKISPESHTEFCIHVKYLVVTLYFIFL